MSTTTASLVAGVIGVFAATSFTASAIEPTTIDKSLARCAAVKSDLERLQCFDDWARGQGMAGPNPQAEPVEGAGQWQITRGKNPVDDTDRVQLRIAAETGHARNRQSPMLALRCESGRSDLVILWHAFLGSERAEVATRIDKDKATKNQWQLSNTHTASFVPGGMFGGFVRRMLDADVLIAEVTPYSEPTITAHFKISGLREAIKPLVEACKLKL